MAYRYHGRANVDSRNPEPFGICDRCGGLRNLAMLRYQFDYNATQLYNKRLRVCSKCMDDPQPQHLAQILPQDPVPIRNPRPQNYATANTGYDQPLECQISTDESAITTFYLDLYYGSPLAGGASVLEDITGSAVREDFAASMGAPVSDVSTNTAEISFTSSAQSSSNITHLAVYDAATGGNLLMSGALLNPETAVLYNGLVFEVGALQVWLNQ